MRQVNTGFLKPLRHSLVAMYKKKLQIAYPLFDINTAFVRRKNIESLNFNEFMKFMPL